MALPADGPLISKVAAQEEVVQAACWLHEWLWMTYVAWWRLGLV